MSLSSSYNVSNSLSASSLPPHKKNKILTESSYQYHKPNTNNIHTSYTHDPIDNHTSSPSHLTSYTKLLHSHDNSSSSNEIKDVMEDYKENNPKDEEENNDTPYTVKQDLKIFIPHDLSSEKLSPQSIPRTRLNINQQSINNHSNNNIQSTSRSHFRSQFYQSTSHSSSKISMSTSTHNLSPESIPTIHHQQSHPLIYTTTSTATTTTTPSSSSSSQTSTKNNHPYSLLNEPHTPTSQSFHRFTTDSDNTAIASTPIVNTKDSNSILTLSDRHPPSLDSLDSLDPFSRHESFHSKNSPTVTIHTKNACAAIYEWFNEPCDEENMDPLYTEPTLSNPDMDHTFYLKQHRHH